MTPDDIKKLIEEMLSAMNIKADAVSVGEIDGRQCFSVKSPDSSLLIGSKGSHLFAFNHLIKKISAKRGAEDLEFSIDVNEYQKAAKENLLQVAKVMGERARSFKTNMELEPMSSYERMIIHSHFQDAKDLKTESVGDGERRRVVIKYTGEAVSF